MNKEIPQILIVDDVPANLFALRAVLGNLEEKINIVQAGSGNEALEKIIEHDFALVLLDAHMPEMDGFEVAEIINSHETLRHIPIIFVTAAYKDKAHRYKGYQAGAVDYLQKPIEEDILLSKVKTFIELFQRREQLEQLTNDLERKVEERTQQLARTQKIAQVGSWSIDRQTMVYAMDPICKSMLSEALLSKGSSESLLDAMQADDKQKVLSQLKEAEQNYLREVKFEFQFVNAKKEKRTAYAIASLSYDANKLFKIEGSIQDISERKATEQQLQYLANHDALTNLPNRYLLKDRLKEVIKRGERYQDKAAILLIDLDYFKEINDSLGHPVGDQLLIEASNRLTSSSRGTDTVARLGGDEFAIILTDIESNEVVDNAAQRYLSELSKPYYIDEHILHSSGSIGIALYPQDSSHSDELMKYADLALYRSKNLGRNDYHFYDEEMGQAIHQQKVMENELRHAIDNNQLELHFQPTINLKDQSLRSVEALIRWNHPSKGLILPEDFLPLAEANKLIIPIGDWALKQACKIGSSWNEKYDLNIKISVNVSAVQLKEADFSKSVSSIIAEQRYSSHLLELEVTETSILDNVKLSTEQLNDLKRLGISIALDDFGSGYSSLMHLKQIPASSLKVDRSFVQQISSDDQNVFIVDIMASIAEKFKLELIAEGVETEEQLDYLKQYEGIIIQGFLFAKPMSDVDFIKWYQQKYDNNQIKNV